MMQKKGAEMMQKTEKTDEKSQFYCVFLIFLVEFSYICNKMYYKIK